jgi:ABC-2 type transport system permease protein
VADITAAQSFGIYRRMLGARMRADWQYRTSFFLYLIGQTLLAATDFAAVVVVFSSVDQLAGWTGVEVAFLFGMSGLAFGIGDFLISPVEFCARHIKAGTFDQFLIRPVGAMWQLLATEFALRRLGRTFQPAVVLVISLGLLDVQWTPAKVVLVVVSIICGTAIYGTVWVLTSCLAFWTTETQELASSFTYGGNAANRYPIDVLGRWLRRLVTFVVPLASVAYLPASWILDKPTLFGLPVAAAWSGPLVAAAMVAVTRVVWGHAIRHYRSTGS